MAEAHISAAYGGRFRLVCAERGGELLLLEPSDPLALYWHWLMNRGGTHQVNNHDRSMVAVTAPCSLRQSRTSPDDRVFFEAIEGPTGTRRGPVHVPDVEDSVLQSEELIEVELGAAEVLQDKVCWYSAMLVEILDHFRLTFWNPSLYRSRVFSGFILYRSLARLATSGKALRTHHSVPVPARGAQDLGHDGSSGLVPPHFGSGVSPLRGAERLGVAEQLRA